MCTILILALVLSSSLAFAEEQPPPEKVAAAKKLVEERQQLAEDYVSERERQEVVTIVAMVSAMTAATGLGAMTPLSFDLASPNASPSGGSLVFGLFGCSAILVGTLGLSGATLFELLFFDIERKVIKLNEKTAELDEAVMAF